MSKDLTIVRYFDAPVPLVWKAWTDPQVFMKWWGPKTFTCPFCEMDLRVGGKYLTCMRGPEGDFWITGEYLEIEAEKKLVYTDNFADEKGNIVEASHYGMPNFEHKLVVTLLFEEENGKTKMTLIHTGLPEGEMSEMTAAGWNESFDKIPGSIA